MTEKNSSLSNEPNRRKMLPVWFFIGALLFFYGAVILVVGILSFSHPPEVVLAKYHADLWGGIFLIAIGGTFMLSFLWHHRAKEGSTSNEKELVGTGRREFRRGE